MKNSINPSSWLGSYEASATTPATFPSWKNDIQLERKEKAHHSRKQRIALRASGKRKKYARPISESEKIDTGNALIAKVIRTLESNGLALSLTDKDDARQAGMGCDFF